MFTFLRDLRFAFRMFVSAPSFSIIAVVTIALGIGAATAIFTVLNAVVLRPLPYPEPERLVELHEQNLERGWETFAASAANFADWRAMSQSFESMAVYSGFDKVGFNLTGDGRAERLTTCGVGEGFFEVFGVRPQLGYWFEAEHDVPGKDHVAILSDGFWRRRYGGDPGIVGRSIELDGESYQVVGVMPPQFQYPPKVDLWLPLALSAEKWQSRTVRTLQVRARLKEDVSLQQAQAEMDLIGDRLEAQYPGSNQGFGIVAFDMHERTVGNVRPRLLLVFGIVLLVLLIACANTANLLLARATGRRKELALRTALGAGRGQLFRQLLTESLLLGLVGGVVGIGLAWGGVRLLLNAGPSYLPRLGEVAMDLRVLLFALLLALGSGLVFGLLPAFRASRTRISEVLNEGGRSGTEGVAGGRLRSILVILEVAIAVVVLVLTGQMIQSFLELQKIDPGFDQAPVLSMELPLPAAKYGEGFRQADIFREILERVRALPGVESAGVINRLPLRSTTLTCDFFNEGDPPKGLEDVLVAEFRAVSPGYFRTMGVERIQGRPVAESDRKGAPVVGVINEAMARQYWPGQEAVGKRIRVGTLIGELLPGLPLDVEIVGVVEDVQQFALNIPTAPQLHFGYEQYPFASMFLTLRAAKGNPQALMPGVRRILEDIDPDIPIYDVATMADRVGESVSEPRFNMILLVIFAGVAMLLSAVGIYGVLAYSVEQRAGEIGIRMALGADSRTIRRQVLTEGLTRAGIGAGVGLLGAVLMTLVLRSYLFEVAAASPWTFVAVLGVIGGVALIACLLPSQRASRVDPMTAIRSN
jgi:putative ABC transport system permease protein